MKINMDNTYIDFKKKFIENKVEEQYKELKRIIPDQSFFKRRVEKPDMGSIRVYDRRYKSLASESGAIFISRGHPTLVVNYENYMIFLEDGSLFDVVKIFAERYGYQELNCKFQV